MLNLFCFSFGDGVNFPVRNVDEDYDQLLGERQRWMEEGDNDGTYSDRSLVCTSVTSHAGYTSRFNARSFVLFSERVKSVSSSVFSVFKTCLKRLNLLLTLEARTGHDVLRCLLLTPVQGSILGA